MNANLDYDILEDDQKRIVEFSKLFNKKNQAEAQLKVLKEQLQSLNDAEEELMINMEEPYLQIGDCFLKVEDTDLEGHLAKQKEEVNKEINQLQESCEEWTAKLAELKAMLYAKFGNRINLDA